MQVVKCAKDLLSSLYDKVVLSKNMADRRPEEIVYEPIQQKEFQIPLQTYYKKAKGPENPNYVGQEFLKKKEVPKYAKLKS